MDAIYVSVNSFKVLYDKTLEFNPGRRVRCWMGDDGIKYATVVSRSFAANYTTVVIDESELTSNLTEVQFGIVQTGTYGSIPDHDHSGAEATGGFVQLITLQDTPNAYDDTKYLKSTTSGVDWIDINEDTTRWFSGPGSPLQSLGTLGDYYQDDTNDYVYRKYLGGNYTTWNSLDSAVDMALTNGDLTVELLGTDAWHAIRSTVGVTSGKWYWEVHMDNAVSTNDFMVGVGTSSETLTYPGDSLEGRGYHNVNGQKYKSSGAAYGDTYAEGDIIGVALDLDNGKLWWSKNGVWQASGDPAIGLNAAYSDLLDVADPYYAMVGLSHHYSKNTANFGASAFTYGVPTGFNSGLFDAATGAWNWVGSLTESLVGMVDTPAGYDEGKYLRSTHSGTEWATTSGAGVQTFLDLSDTPETYLEANGQFLIVNSVSSELEFTTLSGVLQKTIVYTGEGEPTLAEPAQAVEQDYYINTDTAVLYERQEAHSYIMVSDTFSGIALDEAKWGTRIIPYANITVNDALELNNETGGGASGAYVYSQDTFNTSGITTLTCKWWPHNDHASGAIVPTISFRHPTDFATSGYGEPTTNRMILYLGANGNTTDRTSMTLYDGYSNPNIDTVSISITEMAWHDLEIIMNWDTSEISVDLNSGAYQMSGYVSPSAMFNIGNTFRVELGTADSNKVNTEKFKNVVLSTTNSGVWESRGIIDRPGSHWWTDNGIPSTTVGLIDDYYLDNGTEGVYIKTTTASGFVSWNPDDSSSQFTFSNGDLTTLKNFNADWESCRATGGVTTGKWYWEVTIDACPSVVNRFMIGFGHDGTPLTNYVGADANGYAYYASTGSKYHGGSATYGPTATVGDIIGCALDLDNKKVWWSKNGTWMNSGDPETGTNPGFSSLPDWVYYPMLGNYDINDVCTFNFGATAFAHTPPTGFNAGFFTEGVGGWVYRGELLAGTLISQNDTPNDYEAGKYLRSTLSGTETEWSDPWITGAGTPAGGLGDIANFYLNITTKDVYLKQSGWQEDSQPTIDEHNIGSNQEGLDGFTLKNIPTDNGDYYTFNGTDSGLYRTGGVHDESDIDVKVRFRIHNKVKNDSQNIWKSGGVTNSLAIGLDSSNNLGVFGRRSATLRSITIDNTQFEENTWYIMYASSTRMSLFEEVSGSFIEAAGEDIAPDTAGSDPESIGYSENTEIIGGGGSDGDYFEGDVDYAHIFNAGDLDFPDAVIGQWNLVGTLSGTTSSGGTSDVQTLLDLTDTPSVYDEGKYLRSTTSGTEWATVSGSGAGSYLAQNGSTPLTGDWNYGSYTISGTGDIYCNDIFTSSGTVYIGSLKLSTDGQNLLVNDDIIEGGTSSGTDGIDGVDGATWYTGNGAPSSSSGTAFDYYLDETSGDIYRKDYPTYGSNLCTGGTVTSFNATNPTNIFDGNEGTTGDINGGTGWVGYEFTLAKVLIKFRIKGNTNGDAFHITASTTGAFAGEEDTLVSSNFTAGSGWQEFVFSNTTAYTHFRLYNDDGSYWRVAEVEAYDASGYDWQTTGGNLQGPAGADAPTTFSGLSDTPDTYEDGYYLRMTASGITTVSGIILEAPNGSEWLLQVTNSGILYTTEVI